MQTPDHDLDQDYDFNVGVQTEFLAEQSAPSRNRYVFAYKITITNSGSQSAQLMSRKWLITDGDGKTQEVSGDGVVGQQPVIEPGKRHQYTSGTVLETKVGSMSGLYQMVAADGHEFSASIPPFTLSYPNALH
ncbi:MAG: Co2+/Mg2+ efflux protein ApaG [Oceanospirillaceae bacterium]|nr:Co2+/Mg2+ efflux protein ApaG [Oceanospirillaceae bacterium]